MRLDTPRHLPFHYLHDNRWILPNTIINKTITITASPEKVWRVFTDPVVTRQMGGEYISAWRIGESLGWKGEDGKMSTYGIILELEENQLLKHNLYDLKTKSRLTSTITYRLEDKGKYTILHAEEELAYDMRDDQFEEAIEGWDLALETVRELAEKLQKADK